MKKVSMPSADFKSPETEVTFNES